MAAATYFERSKAYAQRVVEGREVAGEYERLACRRFLNDLARQGAADFPYVIDEARGSRACRFQELLPHIKGEWAKPVYVDGKIRRQRIRLEDWQVFIEFQLFGWVHAETRLRRFLRSYEEIARKNAKSTRAAGRLLYMTVADDEPGAHTYSAATTGDQAREVFDVARNMALMELEFAPRFGAEIGKHDITVPSTASSSKPLNAEGSTLDGLNVHFAVVDEVHAHKTRAVWDVIDSATGARAQPMVSAITTAGSDRAGICYELRDYTVKVLTGVHVDETWFGIIYTIDAGDDWRDPAVWRKANPNLGVSVKEADMERACNLAKATPSARANFLTKRLNVWINADMVWMDMLRWDECEQHELGLEDFKGQRCWIGMDLAEKSDFAALCLVFLRGDLWYVFPRLYINRAALQASNNAFMSGWEDEGHIIVNDGDVTDFNAIAEDLRQFCKDFDVQEVDFDPAFGQYFATTLLAEGLPMVQITQKATFFTQPLIQIENLVLERKLRHDGNDAMTWMISNVMVSTSKFTGLKHPTKAKPELKIDGPVAMFLGIGRAMVPAEPEAVIRADYDFATL